MFRGKIVILGFGSIGCGLLPLLLKHFPAEKILILGGDNRNVNVAAKYGVAHIIEPIVPDNLDAVLTRYLQPGDFLVNLSVNVSTRELVIWCREHEALYMDTCIEPWEGFYTDTSVAPERRSNYALRQEMLDLRQQWEDTGSAGPTALLAHGANPGLVNHFVKRALVNIARDLGGNYVEPTSRAEWVSLAQNLGLRVIHIAERDTQTPKNPKQRDEFVNTWSVDGFVSEGLQPSELGWGTHEREFPQDGHRYTWGCQSSIWLEQPSCVTQVRSWTPLEGPYRGWLVTHNESISISDYFSNSEYRPTVHYAYHPCDAAVLSMHELSGKNFQQQPTQRLIVDEVESGVDELGVLLMGSFGAYWYGSQLDINIARSLAPHNNATSLQVVVAVLAGILWCIAHPRKGVLEADELPYEEIMKVTDPYMGEMVGQYTSWTPLQDRGVLFPETLDTSDPWQFKNFRV